MGESAVSYQGIALAIPQVFEIDLSFRDWASNVLHERPDSPAASNAEMQEFAFTQLSGIGVSPTSGYKTASELLPVRLDTLFSL
jgi:hypothetical protein